MRRRRIVFFRDVLRKHRRREQARLRDAGDPASVAARLSTAVAEVAALLRAGARGRA
jgi:hypothetical protein